MDAGALHGAGPDHVRLGRAFPAHGRPRLAQNQRPADEGDGREAALPAPASGGQPPRRGSAFGARVCSRRTWSRLTAFRCTCSFTRPRPITGWRSNPWPRCCRGSTRPRASLPPRQRPIARLVAAIDRSIALTPVVAVEMNLSLVYPLRPLRPRVCRRGLGLAPLPGARRGHLLGHSPVGGSVAQPGRTSVTCRPACPGTPGRPRRPVVARK